MRNKKQLMMVSVILGCIMLFGSAFAFAAGNTGYEAYKTAIKNTHNHDNFTMQYTIEVIDNGQNILSGEGISKVNRINESMSSQSNLVADGQTYTNEMYAQENQIIFKNNGESVYKVMEKSGLERKGGKDSQDQGAQRKEAHDKYAQDIENIIDAMVGNLQNYVVKNDSEISFNLTGNQIPPVANAVTSLLVKVHSNQDGQSKSPHGSMGNVLGKQNLPSLTENIVLNNVSGQANLTDQDQIAAQNLAFTISGQDSAGTTHELKIVINIDLYDFGQTVPDSVDLSGQTVEKISHPNRN